MIATSVKAMESEVSKLINKLDNGMEYCALGWRDELKSNPRCVVLRKLRSEKSTPNKDSALVQLYCILLSFLFHDNNNNIVTLGR